MEGRRRDLKSKDSLVGTILVDIGIHVYYKNQGRAGPKNVISLFCYLLPLLNTRYRYSYFGKYVWIMM